MRDALIHASAALLLLTGIAHSWLGERRLIGPALADRSGLYARELTRIVTRLAWHVTTMSWVAIAGLMLLVVDAGDDALVRGAALIVGIVFLTAGLIDAVLSRGRHVGWPMLTGVGALALASLAV